ncbi:MAG: hypothetical protein V1697_02590 [Candidatus Levyibacteriota bacterium]
MVEKCEKCPNTICYEAPTGRSMEITKEARLTLTEEPTTIFECPKGNNGQLSLFDPVKKRTTVNNE